MTAMLNFLHHCWLTTLELAPWLLLGMFLAGLLHVLLPDGFIQRHLGRRRFRDVFKAVVIGVPMPLCSCGVIPAAVGLKKDGASDGASVGFLVSTPQTGVDSILVSAIFLGWPFAWFKVFSALVSGLVAGMLTNITAVKPEQTPVAPSACHAQSTETGQSKQNVILAMVRFGIFELLHDIYRWLIIGILVAALINTLLPQGRLAEIWWTQGISGLVAMLILSLPMYICATASVPLAASLVVAGMSPGAALVLLMAGPTTNVATVGAIYRTFGKKIAAIYLGTVILMSLLFGYFFDRLLGQVSTPAAYQESEPSWLAAVSAVLLIALLSLLGLRDIRNGLKKSAASNNCSG